MPILIGASLLAGGFSLGQYLRPPSPPLIIQRAALSPLSDLPAVTAAAKTNGVSQAASPQTTSIEGRELADVVYTRVLVASSRQEDLVATWEVVRAAFGEHDVPSTLFGVTVLGYTDQLVEVEAVAAVVDAAD